MKKILYIILILVLSMVLVLQIKNKLEKVKVNDNDYYADIKEIDTIINTNYNVPIIESAINEGKLLKIEAGVYRYGDVNKDSIINLYDIKTIEYIIYNGFAYSMDEKELADINKNGIIDTEDLDLLSDYVNKVEYNSNSNLAYCILNDNNVNQCDWTINNTFYISDNNKKYLYVKGNNILSSVYEYINDGELNDIVINEVE